MILRVTNSQPAPRDLVVEEDAGAGEEAVALAVVDGDEVAVDLGDAVGAARIERRLLVLRRLRAPCRTSRARRPGRSGPRADLADRLEHARHPDRRELGGQRRLVARTARRTTSRRGCRSRRARTARITSTSERWSSRSPGAGRAGPGSASRRSKFSVGGAADHAVDLVALLQQELGQVAAVLAGDAGDQCALHVIAGSIRSNGMKRPLVALEGPLRHALPGVEGATRRRERSRRASSLPGVSGVTDGAGDVGRVDRIEGRVQVAEQLRHRGGVAGGRPGAAGSSPRGSAGRRPRRGRGRRTARTRGRARRGHGRYEPGQQRGRAAGCRAAGECEARRRCAASLQAITS